MTTDTPDSPRRFVTVTAADPAAAQQLGTRGLDLFGPASAPEGGGVAIDGHLTERQIGQLLVDGYQVDVHEPVPERPLEIAGALPTVAELAAADAPPLAVDGYMAVESIYNGIKLIAAAAASCCSVVPLPERSVEGREILALRIRGGGAGDRPGVLLLGGMHARELINPDLLCIWAQRLSHAYQHETGMRFGSVSYDAGMVRLIVNSLDILVVPLVNPDGRDHVMTTNRMWRGNRAFNPGQPCRGVDLNRNFDFLFDSGFGTSTNSCDEVYRGPSAFSEPETRNVRWLLDNFPHLAGLCDVHSYGEVILYPWSDDDNQTHDPGQNFRVPNAFRGILDDDRYREYLPAADQDWYLRTTGLMRDAIAKNRGRVYRAQQGARLYFPFPTSATVDDYAYSRAFANPALRSVRAVTIETHARPAGGSQLDAFQPPYQEAMAVMRDVGPGLVEFCLSVACPDRAGLELLAQGRALLEAHLPAEGPARDLHDQLLALAPRLLTVLNEQPRLRARAVRALRRLVAGEADPRLEGDTADALAAVATELGTALPAAAAPLACLAALARKTAGQPLSQALRVG